MSTKSGLIVFKLYFSKITPRLVHSSKWLEMCEQ